MNTHTNISIDESKLAFFKSMYRGDEVRAVEAFAEWKEDRRAKRAIERSRSSATVFAGFNGHNVLTYYARKLSNDKVVRGLQRSGIRAKDFTAECEFANEEKPVLVEVPAQIIRSMRMETKLTAMEEALYWRLFAHARWHGISAGSHTIVVKDLKRFLGINNTARLLGALKNVRDAVVSYHFNNSAQNGRKSMKLIDIDFTDAQLAKLHFKDTLTFRLPVPVKVAVESCREYAWVSLNALARFKSRFARPLFMRMALMSGRHAAFRSSLVYTREQMIEVLDLPQDVSDFHLIQALDFAERDIERLSRTFRRFSFDRFRPDEGHDAYKLMVSGSLRTVRDCRAKSIPESEAKQILDPSKNRLAKNEYPTLLMVRKAATLHGVSAVAISTAYSTALNAVRSKPYSWIAGMFAVDFFNLIKLCGADEAFAHFADNQDMSVFKINSKRFVLGEQVRRHDKLVFVPFETETVVVEPEFEHEDDLRLCSDYDDFDNQDALEPMPSEAFAEINDDEIDF